MNIKSPQELLNFDGKVVIVSGSGSGLGRGIAVRFAEAGAAVVVNYRSSAGGAREVVSRIKAAGGKALSIQADVSQRADVERLIMRTVEQFGRIDVLVNNAGAIPGGDLWQVDEKSWREAWDLKVFGYINMCREFYSAMKQNLLHQLQSLQRFLLFQIVHF